MWCSQWLNTNNSTFEPTLAMINFLFYLSDIFVNNIIIHFLRSTQHTNSFFNRQQIQFIVSVYYCCYLIRVAIFILFNVDRNDYSVVKTKTDSPIPHESFPVISVSFDFLPTISLMLYFAHNRKNNFS